MIRTLLALSVALFAGVVLADTELGLAAKAGDLAKVRQLTEAGADMNATNDDDLWERTPLMQAARLGRTEVVTFLLAKGADVTKPGDATGASPLKEAAYKGHIEIVRALLAAGAKPDYNADDQGRTPLLWALIGKETNTPAVVEALLKAGANSQAVFESLDGAKVTAAEFAHKAGPEVEAAFTRNAPR